MGDTFLSDEQDQFVIRAPISMTEQVEIGKGFGLTLGSNPLAFKDFPMVVKSENVVQTLATGGMQELSDLLHRIEFGFLDRYAVATLVLYATAVANEQVAPCGNLFKGADIDSVVAMANRVPAEVVLVIDIRNSGINHFFSPLFVNSLFDFLPSLRAVTALLCLFWDLQQAVLKLCCPLMLLNDTTELGKCQSSKCTKNWTKNCGKCKINLNSVCLSRRRTAELILLNAIKKSPPRLDGVELFTRGELRRYGYYTAYGLSRAA